MATPAHTTPNRPRNSDAEATLLLMGLAMFMAVGGLAKCAERSPTVLAVLDWLAMPVLQAIAAHSPGFHHFMRQAQPFTWYMIEAAIIVLPLFAAVGIYLLFTYDTRRLKRAARRQLYARRENARLNEMTDEMEAKEPSGRDQPKTGKTPRPGGAATDAERLKDVFRKQPSE